MKILDFGLARQAKAVGPARGGDGANLGPTETLVAAGDKSENLTEAGTVLGTASYMSPEQALGKQTDFRSDQFSLGLILHELASGKRAFAKASKVETMAAIVREEAPQMDEKVLPPLRWIVDRCLAKEPEQRYESTRDLFRELRNLRDHYSEAHTSAVFAPVTPRQKTEPLENSGLLRGLHAPCRIARLPAQTGRAGYWQLPRHPDRTRRR